jgi:hypothetical protein
MTNDWYTPDNSELMVAKKMATWRNADAKLETADVYASDEYMAGRLREPAVIAEPIGSTNSHLGKWRDSRVVIGTWQEILKFQTARNLYPFYGICATTGVSDPYTHTMGIRTTQTPINMGRHWQRVNTTTAENELIDILGMLPYSTHIECSELVTVAQQFNNWMVAYTKNTSTDLITTPTAITKRPFRWEDFTFPTFTYNSETVEADIIGWSHDVMCGLRWVNPDSTYRATTGMSYYTKGKILNFQLLATTLEIIPYGHNAFELIRTALSKYATDLDLTVKCARTATDYCQWTHDKLYCTPYDISVNKTPGSVESYLLTMHQLNTGSCVPVALDYLDINRYEVS